MRASGIKVNTFLSSPKTRFVIPIYQRNYDWSIAQCKQLLDDIFEVGRSRKKNAYFIGSIVFVHNEEAVLASDPEERTIIDGQQRLTTLTLIYLVIHRIAKELNKKNLEDEIKETYLINKFSPEEGKLKLRPTENNDKALKYLLDGDDNEASSQSSKLITNFEYLKMRITKDNYKIVLKGLAQLMLVEISLDRGRDEAQKIFESLNSTGLELSQADLIRNYILIGLEPKDQKDIYEKYWEVIEKYAKDKDSNSRISHYIRDYLTLKNKEIPNIGKVYIKFKAKYPTESPVSIPELKKNLTEMNKLVKHYNKLINPEKESDEEIRLHLNYINRLEVNVAFPFLMQVYDDFESKIIDKPTFLKVLELIQSFTWRRFIVGLPTNALNRIFMNLYDKVNRKDYLSSIQKSLLQKLGGRRFPKDREVIEALKIKDVYNIKPKSRVYFLERLENFENKEVVPIEGNRNITIEHIFPKNPDLQWKDDLGHDYTSMENYLHAIGNLTLTGDNSKLSNKPFMKKRVLYSKSRLWMNRYLSNLERWGVNEIEKRIDLISERFLKIWEYPQVEVETDNDNGAINIFDADNPTHKNLEYAIFRDQKLEITQVRQLYEEVFKQLFKEQPDVFFTSDLSSQISLTNSASMIKKMRKAVQIDDTYFIEANMDSVSKFERIKRALEIFELEEELFIKYAENK